MALIDAGCRVAMDLQCVKNKQTKQHIVCKVPSGYSRSL